MEGRELGGGAGAGKRGDGGERGGGGGGGGRGGGGGAGAGKRGEGVTGARGGGGEPFPGIGGDQGDAIAVPAKHNTVSLRGESGEVEQVGTGIQDLDDAVVVVVGQDGGTGEQARLFREEGDESRAVGGDGDWAKQRAAGRLRARSQINGEEGVFINGGQKFTIESEREFADLVGFGRGVNDATGGDVPHLEVRTGAVVSARHQVARRRYGDTPEAAGGPDWRTGLHRVGVTIPGRGVVEDGLPVRAEDRAAIVAAIGAG